MDKMGVEQGIPSKYIYIDLTLSQRGHTQDVILETKDEDSQDRRSPLEKII